jgi:hypothetical protein
MNNLIGRLERPVVGKAVGITLQFLLEGEDAVGEIVGAIPGLG